MASKTKVTPQKEEMLEKEGSETRPDSQPLRPLGRRQEADSQREESAGMSLTTRSTRCCPRRRSNPSRSRTSARWVSTQLRPRKPSSKMEVDVVAKQLAANWMVGDAPAGLSTYIMITRLGQLWPARSPLAVRAGAQPGRRRRLAASALHH
jgi:hypothetical protein